MRAIKFFRAVITGTALAFLIALGRPLIAPAYELLKPYLLPFPPYARTQALIVGLLIIVTALLARVPEKIWRSLKLGLIPLEDSLWVLSTVIFWVALDLRHAFLAIVIAGAGVLLATSVDRIIESCLKVPTKGVSHVESDLPVPEGGEDLLGRRDIVDTLISTVLLEQASIVAVTGGYGDGKTSLLNLAVGEIRKLTGDDLPVIVRFSPWLAGDSNSLVLSLFNSIVAEVKNRFIVPGLGRDAARYARVLLSAIPRVERFKDFILERSQEQRIVALAEHIAKTQRRVLVVLDDLDRMGADELDTVFKILRGSDRLSNITFLCSFDKSEIARILQSTRPEQDTNKFIEKFFEVQVALPKLDSAERRHLFSERLLLILDRYGVRDEDFSKSIEKIWENGAELYFENLRRIKLFVNRIGQSLERIASEVNPNDFIRLELIRDIAPNIYELIYSHPEYFYKRDFAFETSFKGPSFLDKDEAKKDRAVFYDKMKSGVPEDKQYVFDLCDGLFPDFASYRKVFGADPVSASEAEQAKRIYHPRCFRQYFLLKVPTELFSQKEFKSFVVSIQEADEDDTAKKFCNQFQSIVKEDFKRWHFMHLIANRFDEFKLEIARGLCRGMARESAIWSLDAFELMIAVQCTRETIQKTAESDGRINFLRAIIHESASDLYSLALLRRLEDHLKPDPSEVFLQEQSQTLGIPLPSVKNAQFLSELTGIKVELTKLLRSHYLGPNPPSVFEQFGDLGVGRIEPNAFLLAWHNLGGDAESDQREYLKNLFAGRPQDLDKFLKLLFRADFVDDYTTLKPLIDYGDLSQLITSHENILDSANVSRFRKRYGSET